MKIISWNVNGLRANVKKGGFDWLMAQNADIFCMQEIKAEADQLPPEVRAPKGYHAFFESSKTRKGYSGVAIYSKVEPLKVEFSVGNPELDQEGRMITAFYEDFVFINCYFPNGGGGPERLAYKLKFYDAFLEYINKLKKKGHEVIFCGDINTAHTEIDLARPKENVDNTGFLPIERAWLDKVVKNNYFDVFRSLNPEKKEAYTYWDMKTFARDRNVGWRIDYFFVTKGILEKVKEVSIHNDILGSDHCPLSIKL
ncbi:MAG: exodeoxyribonuclease III [Candidatus Pacebacteria bacterium]|nr:exodeoxyribonuclease III [Candidatus Paceibacterota bacterium]